MGSVILKLILGLLSFQCILHLLRPTFNSARRNTRGKMGTDFFHFVFSKFENLLQAMAGAADLSTAALRSRQQNRGAPFPHTGLDMFEHLMRIATKMPADTTFASRSIPNKRRRLFGVL